MLLQKILKRSARLGLSKLPRYTNTRVSQLSRSLNRFYSAKRDPYSVLGLETKKKTLTEQELNNRFRELSFKYHPDLNQAKESVSIYMEIKDSFEEIRGDFQSQKAKQKASGSSKTTQEDDFDPFDFAAAHNFSDFKKQSRTNQADWDYKTDEEYLFNLIFGHHYQNHPERFFLKENAEKRKIFREKVCQIRNKKDDPKISDKQFMKSAFITDFRGVGQKVPKSEKEEKLLKFIAAGVVALALGTIIYMTIGEHRKNLRMREKRGKSGLKEEDILNLRQRERKFNQKIRGQRIDKLEETMDKMLKYPNQDPPANHMLVKYTIWKDIDVSSTFVHRLENNPELLADIISGKEEIPSSLINNHRHNLYISIALEVERRLKKTYVEVKQVKKDLRSKGFYDAPSLLFRYKGPLHAKIRKDKPLNIDALEKCKGKYISLFDLYFKYTSPIPSRHPLHPDFYVKQNERVPGMTSSLVGKYLGFVTMNMEKLEDYIVKPKEKVVTSLKDIGPWNSREYDFIWNTMYYRKSLAKHMEKIFFFEDRNHPILKNNKKVMFFAQPNASY